MANRCVPLGAEPVPLGSARIVVEPARIGVVQSAAAGGDVPATVTFGGPSAHDQELLLSFPDTWMVLHVDAAFLLLEAAPAAAPTGPDVPVSVTLASAAWSSGSVARGPASKPPSSVGLARTRPPSLLRIDVTSQLRALQRQPDHGLIVRAERAMARGATYFTGADGGGPRLDVYGRRKAEPR